MYVCVYVCVCVCVCVCVHECMYVCMYAHKANEAKIHYTHVGTSPLTNIQQLKKKEERKKIYNYICVRHERWINGNNGD